MSEATCHRSLLKNPRIVRTASIGRARDASLRRWLTSYHMRRPTQRSSDTAWNTTQATSRTIGTESTCTDFDKNSREKSAVLWKSWTKCGTPYQTNHFSICVRSICVRASGRPVPTSPSCSSV
jgi:hypothetical protein